VPEDQLLPVAGGEPVRLSDDVIVRVFPSQHSCGWTKAAGVFEADAVCLGDLGVTHQERLERFGEMRALIDVTLVADEIALQAPRTSLVDLDDLDAHPVFSMSRR
jgi:hypothetical protein